jgi:O-antigen/teichoic acid export membrane protein
MTAPGFSDASRKVTRSQLVIAATEAIRFALLLFLTSTLGRNLAPDDFGFVTLVPTIYLFAHTVLDLGTGALIARESVRRPERERPLLEAALAARSLGGGVIGLVVAAFALAEPDPARRVWLVVTALTLPALAPAVIGAAFRIRQDQAGPAALSLVTIGLMIAAVLLGLRADLPGPAFAGIYVLREVVNGAGLWLMARARHGLRLRPGLAGRDAGRFFLASIPQNTAVVFQIASLNAGVFGTRLALGETQLGAYSAAWRLVSPVLLLMGALVAPLLPVLAQAARDPGRFRRVLAPSVACGAGIGALGVAFVFAAGRDALRVLYDSPESVKFSSGPLDAGPVLLMLGFVFAAVSVGAVATTALLCLDGDRQLRSIAIMALLVNVAVLSFSLPRHGRVAAAAGLLAAEVLTAVWALAATRARLGALGGLAIVRGAAPVAFAVLALLALPGRLDPLARVAAASGIAALAIGWLVVLGPGRALRKALHEAAP